MGKDQLYGGLIFLASLMITIVYIAAFFAKSISAIFPAWPAGLAWWAIAIPIFLLVLAVLTIAMWIGWTMLTTPPPAPIEDIEAESTDEESND